MKSLVRRNIFISIICLLLMIPSVIYAHGIFLTLEEPGVLKVEYDGGGFSEITEITIYDEEGKELDKGLVDEEGKYYFDSSLNVYSATADDGMGHKAHYQEGVEVNTLPKVPVVIAVFAVVGIIFVIFNKKSKAKIAV